MEFLRLLEDLRTPALSAFLAAITHLGAEVTAATGLPCRVLNDVHAHALGEARRGTGVGYSSAIVVGIGTGVGGGEGGGVGAGGGGISSSSRKLTDGK